MAKVEGVDKVLTALRTRITQAQADAGKSVVVGYSANYSLYVHENLEAHHKVGMAKFLETPARTMKDVIAADIAAAVKRGMPLLQAMLLGGLRLQRESQLLCPVQFGFLRNSAYTRLEAT